MGTWGSGLYANDTTCDVRDTYMGFLQDGLNNQNAYEKTLLEMHEYIEDEDEAPLFWYALAETQWKTGRLMPEVRKTALEWIAKGGGLSLWQENSGKASGWQKTLAKLKEKLESPMPQEKKIHKPVVPNQNFWNQNDLYAYQFPVDIPECAHLARKYIVLQKIGEVQDHTPGVKMRIQAYDKLFDQLPSLVELKEIRLLSLDARDPIIHSENCKADPELVMSRLICLDKANEYPSNQLTYIGNQPGPQNEVLTRHAHWLLSWWRINSWLPKFYTNWHHAEYRNEGNGIYLYSK